MAPNITFQLIAGKNNKYYVKIDNIKTSLDIEIHETIKKALFRKEYKPFLQSFNKNVTASYLFNDIWFPAQLWFEVYTAIKAVHEYEPILQNQEELFYNDITREEFDEWVQTLKVPDGIDVNSDKYKYQQDSVFEALRNKIGRIEVGTSGGKTFITYLYCRYILEHITNWKTSSRDTIENDLSTNISSHRILVIVPSKLLATQLKSDFENYSKNEEKKVIVESIFSGSKRVSNAHVLCGTYQSLSDYDKEFFEGFRFIICDELHRAKAYSIKTGIYDKITTGEFFFGMTGTFPKQNTLDYLHICSMFGKNLLTKTVRSLIDDGISTPVDIRVIEINYDSEADYSKNLIESGIVGTEKYRTEKAFFQNHPERNKIICKLLNHFHTNALILVDTIEYCYVLEKVLSEFFGDQRTIHIINGFVSDRENIINNMKQTKSNFILIGTYGTMSTGVSIPTIGQLYFVDGGKSEIRIRQSIGRGIRLDSGKKKCLVFDFFDNMKQSSFRNHARERIKIYKEQKLEYKVTNITI